MPAIQLARLKIQAAQLADLYSQPALFVRRLLELFDFYADRTYRAGQAGVRIPQIAYFHIPKPVMRQLEQELTQICASHPQEAITLADELWKAVFLETRRLAIHILCQVDPIPPEPILARLRSWAQPAEEPQLLDALLASGRTCLQKNRPDLWLNLLQNWLNDEQPLLQAMGLRALISLVNDLQFKNLPFVFTLLMPVIRSHHRDLQPEVINLVAALADRTPVETAYFIHQALQKGREPPLVRVVRRCLPCFPADQQAFLRQSLSGLETGRE
jgi:hypothetical protein